MKTYSVKEIADLLNTNPETVRRWIRDKKLDATIESKKGGHIIYESALHTFLKSSPKYASIASMSLISTAMIGGLITQKIMLLRYQQGKLFVSTTFNHQGSALNPISRFCPKL